MSTKTGLRFVPGLRGGLLVALVGGSFSPVVSGAPGDLDPAFGDIGRFVPDSGFSGPALTILSQSPTEIIVAGGAFRVNFESPRSRIAVGYLSRLSNAGMPDPGFAGLNGTRVDDAVIQPDGKIVGVSNQSMASRVFRLESNGAPDAGFGLDGQVAVLSGFSPTATSVVLDPDGRIVMAGRVGSELRVTRLLPTGEVDASFASAGTFAGSGLAAAITSIQRAGNDGYRVLTADASAAIPTCRVLALTANGAVDTAYGDQGLAGLGTLPGSPVSCRQMANASSGRLLIVGYSDQQALAVRLLADGSVDAGFSPSALAASMTRATALAVAADDSAVVAGNAPDDVAGVVVLRMKADGSLDSTFGNAGSATIDLRNGMTSVPVANDLQVTADGKIVIAGAMNGKPFVAQLFAAASTNGPGVMGLMKTALALLPDSAQASLVVRRTSGSAGAASVSYHTQTSTDVEFPATEGVDYTAVSGQLQWADGDSTDRQILIPISPGAGLGEEQEIFEVVLENASGGAGLGQYLSRVVIAADGAPAGLLAIQLANDGDEGASAAVWVQRKYYSTGAVSVTVTPAAGTASNADFSANPVTLTWLDGDSADRLVEIPITNDNAEEAAESFTVTLSGATGGAVIGPASATTVTIYANDTPPPPPPAPPQSTGGGGALDWGSLLILFLIPVINRRGATSG